MILVLLAILLVLAYGIQIFRMRGEETEEPAADTPTLQTSRPELDVELLTVNPYSRPGIAIQGVNGIVIHYTANPGTTAMQNRNYFEGLKDSGEAKVSSHFVIGLSGEIVQCIPSSEIAYASNSRNSDTLSIECCHPDKSGLFTAETYHSLIELTAFLCGKFNLTADDVIRHYDITGKLCPKYYVEHEDAWSKFKEDVSTYIEENGQTPSDTGADETTEQEKDEAE